MLAVEAFPTWLWMAMDVGVPMGEPQSRTCPAWGFAHVQLLALPGAGTKGSFSSLGVNRGLIPGREGGEALGAVPWAFSAVPFTECRCAPSFYTKMSFWGGAKPTGASGFMEGRGFFPIPFVGSSGGSSRSSAIPLEQKVKGSLILGPAGLLVVSKSS